jgi:hypothetical protein
VVCSLKLSGIEINKKKGGYMIKLNQQFANSFLNNKLLESLRNLNEIKSAVDPSEEVLIAKIDQVIEQIVNIEI